MDAAELLQRNEQRDLLRFVTAGSVDDGKSTLIGRLLYESRGIYEDQLSAIRALSRREGSAGEELDLALVTDGLKAEREQGITIDVAYRYFSTPRRKFIIADTPGHEQYTRNTATGASTAGLIVLLIDAARGVVTQSKRHAFIAALLGIPHFVVAVNKMDLVGYDQGVFDAIRETFTDFAARLEISDVTFIPVSALRGDNVARRSERMDWYRGGSLLNHLETVHIASDRNLIDLRLPVQCALRPDASFRGYLGTIASGVVRPGDDVLVLPGGARSRVRSVFGPDGKLGEAFCPLATGVTLEDDVDVSRGDIIVHVHNTPRVARSFEAMVVWMDETPLAVGRRYRVKHTTRLVGGAVTELRYAVDVNTLRRAPAESLALNEIGRCALMLDRPVAYDPYARNRTTGSFIMIDAATNRTVAAGMILDRASGEPGDKPPSPGPSPGGPIAPARRRERLGHGPAAIWLTGGSDEDRSELARDLERRLFDAGCLCAAVGGDRIAPRGTGADATRWTAEMARLLTDAGLVAICAAPSPADEDPATAADVLADTVFLTVSLSSGAPADAKPDATVTSGETSTETLAERVLALLRRRGVLDNPSEP